MDLSDAGIDRNAVTDCARLGVITSVQPNVWLFGQATPTFAQQCQAAVWTSDGTLGGPSALVWHNVLPEPQFGLQPTVVLERNNRPTIRDAKTIRSTKFIAGDRCTQKGLSVTSIPRSLLDSAAELSIDELERALDDALLAGKTTITSVKDRMDQALHHRGVRDLRALINDRLPQNGELKGRITRSRAEQRIKRVILSLDVPVPQFNFRIRTVGGGSVELDVAWPEHRVGLNVDGYQWHGGRRYWKRDLQREHQITVSGWNVKRIIPEITDDELFALIATILGSLMG